MSDVANKKNPYLAPPNSQFEEINDLELVCEVCHNVNLNLNAIIIPTLTYKIDQGLLLRIFNRTSTKHEPLICLFCEDEFPKSMWLFWKNWQKEPDLLQKIIDLQNQYNDKSHHVFNAPSANKE